MWHSTLRLLMFVLYVLAASAHSSPCIFDEITYIKNTSSSSGQLSTWNNTCTRKKMAEQRETYKGHEIVVRIREDVSAEGAGGSAAAEAGSAGGEAVDLRIDGKNIFVIQNSSGSYIASGFAFDPQPSPMDLARKIIDYREAGR